MTGVIPGPQQPSPPKLTDLLDALARQVKKEINCVKVGVIQSFSVVTQTATVKVAQQQVTSVAPDGTRTLAEYPLLLSVPVIFPAGGGFTLTFPVAAGDECLVLFNDREIDNWLASGAGLPPITARVHDLSDGFALVGVRSNPRALADVSTDATQLRSDDGTTFVEVNAQGVKVHSGTVYEYDVQGYGQKITWTGGKNYRIDNYTLDAVITTVDHNTAPPGPP